MPRAAFSTSQILAWADAYHQATGQWPRCMSGRIPGTVCESWLIVDRALRSGGRGLPGGSSLVRLLSEHRGLRNLGCRPPLTETQILAWADQHHQRTGRWPTHLSGVIPGTSGETWAAIRTALGKGIRGLPGGTSLARLLSEKRGVRNIRNLPPLTEAAILAWADDHHERTGRWPNSQSGAVLATPGEKWSMIQVALHHGARGWPGGYSLAKLLAEKRGVRNRGCLPKLAMPQILAWADAHHAKSGRWPRADSGPIADAPGETWHAVDLALGTGHRGLAAGSSLTRLLTEHRNIRNIKNMPKLKLGEILRWANDHYSLTGKWPSRTTGTVHAAPGEKWGSVDNALRLGLRGLRGGSSLAQLLVRRRGARKTHYLPPLTNKMILAWADAHFQRTGKWPSQHTGPVTDAPGETWSAINSALTYGLRGRRGGSSLAQFLAKKRGKRHHLNLPVLTHEQIVSWAEQHRRQTGRWPTSASGPIAAAPGETWSGVNAALRIGRRGLPGDSSLACLLAAKAK